MYQQKYTAILSILSKPERNRFRKYLLSPYINDQPDLLVLFDITDKTLRGEAPEIPDKHKLWQKLYPNKPFKDAQLRRLCSDLTQAALGFLSAEARKLSPLAQALDLQRLLERPELKKHLDGVERQIQHLLDSVPGQSTAYYQAQFQLHQTISNRAAKVISATGYADKLATADYYLECFYLTQKLEYYVGSLLFQGSRVARHKIELPEGFWARINDPQFENVPLIAVYRYIILCLNEPDEESHYQHLLQCLEQESEQLSREDLRKCYFIAQNYCALKINQGHRQYYLEVFEIFKTIIRKGLLLDGEHLSEAIFKNIVTSGLGAGDYEWTEKFIEDHTPLLPSNIRENARTYNLATLHFYQRKYHRVIELIRDVEYSDVVYALSAKQLLVRTYYELGEFLALDSLIDSFKIYLRRNKLLSKNQKREYLNFLGFVKNLTILETADYRKVEKIKQKIETASAITPKKWLLEKINALQKKQ